MLLLRGPEMAQDELICGILTFSQRSTKRVGCSMNPDDFILKTIEFAYYYAFYLV